MIWAMIQLIFSFSAALVVIALGVVCLYWLAQAVGAIIAAPFLFVWWLWTKATWVWGQAKLRAA